MDIDSRGVKRGQCFADGCDCTLFERSQQKSIQTCNYCACPPTKHRRIEHEAGISLKSSGEYFVNNTAGKITTVKKQDSFQFVEEWLTKCASQPHQLSENMSELPLGSALDEGSILNEDVKISTNFVPPTRSSTEFDPGKNIATENHEVHPRSSQNELDHERSAGTLQSALEVENPPAERIEKALQVKNEWETIREQAIRNVWPKVWPMAVQMAQRDQKADSVTKNLILRVVKNRLVENNFVDHVDFDIAARCIVQDFSFYSSRINPDHKHVTALLKKCHTNSKSYYKVKSLKKTKNSSASSDTIQGKCEKNITILMEQELAKENPSIPKLKKYLDECRATRVVELKNTKLSTRMHLQKYPALKRSDMVTYEFEKIFGTLWIELKENWTNALSKMKTHFCLESAIDDVDSLTIQTLNRICQKLCKKRKDHPRCIMEIHDESTLLQGVQPRAGDPPHLIGIGDLNKKDVSFRFYVEREPMFSGGVVDALISMYCCYWLFNLNYDVRFQLPFMFVESVLFKEKSVSKIDMKTSIVNLLTDLGII
ncbi:hypothetical protein QAD02_017009 [Eretmocerus hayati]|uniref:Uncharacterized protein n=1 Tax=Eretmocerus hayati TaxID=131215 RepID=A0ACC2PFK0_9HYME|nr:hypothetical protein QAD02_017009 [Eretmocerus hayati]